jgi:hypothetical protein
LRMKDLSNYIVLDRDYCAYSIFKSFPGPREHADPSLIQGRSRSYSMAPFTMSSGVSSEEIALIGRQYGSVQSGFSWLLVAIFGASD